MARLADLEARIEEVADMAEANKPVSGIGIYVSDTAGGNGRSINRVVGMLGVSAGADSFPFQILLRLDSGTWYRGVVFRSLLFDQIGNTLDDDPLTITGLLTTDDPAPSDGGWAATDDGDEIWLEIAVDWSATPPTFTNTIQSLIASATWDGGNVEHDGGTGTPTVYKQTKARVKLGIVEASGSELVVRQYVNDNRRMVNLGLADAYDSSGSSPQPVPALYPWSR